MGLAVQLDIGSLAWVKQEIDTSLDRAAEALRRLVADSATGALLGLAPAHLQKAEDSGQDREQLALACRYVHQAYGALLIVDMSEGVTQYARTLEMLIADLEDGAIHWNKAVELALQEGIASLRNYLDDVMAGQPDQPLRLFAAYQDIVLAREQPEPLPSDLFFPDLTAYQPPRRSTALPPLTTEMRLVRLKSARFEFERGLLRWIRNDLSGAEAMRSACVSIEAVQEAAADRALWWVAIAFFDAAAVNALPDDPLVKRHGARLDAQIRRLIAGGGADTSDRLLRDTLYWVAVAKPGVSGEHVGRVRAAYDLSRHVPPGAAHGENNMRHKRPALRGAREQLTAAMEEWGRFCSGTAAALPAFHETVERFAARTIELQQADLKKLGASLLAYAGQLRKDPLRLDEVAGLEVATALLLAESALDNFAVLGADFSRQADVVATRLAQVTLGNLPPSGKTPDIDALNRRAMETRLIGFVAREIITNLGVVEQTLDGYFRDQRRVADLATLAKPLKQIEGALIVLDQERACAVLRAAEEKIHSFMQSPEAPDRAEFEEVATQFCALGFFAEKLQRGDADIDAILHVQPTHQLAVAETSTATVEDASGVSLATQTVSMAPLPTLPDLNLADEPEAPLLGSAVLPSPLELPSVATALNERSITERSLGAAEHVDPELLGIFIEEAHEVLSALGVATLRLEAASHDTDAMTQMRRDFHTLKGSSRMVGLTDFGEAAWQVEDLLNAWLLHEKKASTSLLQVLATARTLFAQWIDRLEANSPAPDAGALLAQCAALKSAGDDEEAVKVHAPVVAPPALTVAPLEPVTSEAIASSPDIFQDPLHSLFLEESYQHIAYLRQQLPQGGIPTKDVVRAAHTLASIASTAHIQAIHNLAHALENALVRFARAEATPDAAQQTLCVEVVAILGRMANSVAQRRLPEDNSAALIAQLEALAPVAQAMTATHLSPQEVKLAANDDIDLQLLPLFLEEAQDLMHAIGGTLRQWREAPHDAAIAERLKRELHTLKGSARMTGAMSMGELVHQMETRISQTVGMTARSELLDEMDASFDRAAAYVDLLRGVGAAPAVDVVSTADERAASAAALPLSPVEFAPQPHLRVRADLIDRLVDEAGEIGISRARIEIEMRGLKTSLLELTDNVIRLRNQLREIEIQAESQMQSREADANAAQRPFDALELDRFTRFQELTRMMAESVNDVSTVQHNLRRSLDHVSSAITSQARLNRELSQALMGARMVPFNTVADRLHRVVRQTAKELDRRVSLDIRGGQIEIDRSVLERITAPLEHLLRNAVAHGIESSVVRQQAGKSDRAAIDITLMQDGNEIALSVSDDGGGLDLERIRSIAIERQLLPQHLLDDPQALAQLVLKFGFSTSRQIDEISGRGVGMSVVSNEVSGLGGRLEIQNEPGRGVTFRICLPLTLSVMQAVLVRAGTRAYAIPATMVEQASEMKPHDVEKLRAEGGNEWLGHRYPWHYLPHLLGDTSARPQRALRHWVLLLRGKEKHIALEVDAMLGNQEIVVKNIGPQLARIAGIAGATVLGDGEIALILKPVDLAQHALPLGTAIGSAPEIVAAPIVMVVDDSLTVRKITGRLLAREGYHVLTAKDGKDAMEQMSDLAPDVVLADIEMPRMDGFELARTMRGSSRLKHVPIIMITSRIAEKHRNYAEEIGVNHYLGKPYSEDQLLQLVKSYAKVPQS